MKNHGVNMFLVGNHGKFDENVYYVLRELKTYFPHINYHVVLAYMPKQTSNVESSDYSDTILPDGIEDVLPRFAICYQNKWMIEHSDYVVTYVQYSFGGVAKFAQMAQRKNKICINLAEE